MRVSSGSFLSISPAIIAKSLHCSIVDNQKSATDKAVVKQVMIKTERTTEETPVIDFSKIRVPARSAVSKTDWQTLKKANK